MNNYIATQTKDGFYVEFEDSFKQPKNIGFDEIEQFAIDFNEKMLSGETPKLTENDELMLSLWEMLTIPDNNIH